MKPKSVRLFCFGAPFALLPVLGFAFSQVPYWLVGPEGRLLFSQVVTQLLTGIMDTILAVFSGLLFGVQPGL